MSNFPSHERPAAMKSQVQEKPRLHGAKLPVDDDPVSPGDETVDEPFDGGKVVLHNALERDEREWLGWINGHSGAASMWDSLPSSGLLCDQSLLRTTRQYQGTHRGWVRPRTKKIGLDLCGGE